jgi:hypothetical protein
MSACASQMKICHIQELLSYLRLPEKNMIGNVLGMALMIPIV